MFLLRIYELSALDLAFPGINYLVFVLSEYNFSQDQDFFLL